MKKLILFFLLCSGVSAMMAQTTLHISGYVHDSATGSPVAGHYVIISDDSVAGGNIFHYYRSVPTDVFGMYADTILLPAGITSWPFNVSTYTYCSNITYTYNTAYLGGSTTFTHDFSICVPAGTSLPTIITGVHSGTTETSTILHGFVNPNGSQTTVNFEFGTTSSYGHFLSCGQFNGDSLVPVTQTLNGLAPGTLYHYRLMGNNSNGYSYGNDSTFTTFPAGSLPIAITNGATDITISGGTLHGLYNPNGYACTTVLEWGLTTSYGSFESGSATGYNYVSDQISISGYPPNTTIHYRASIIYSGGTVYGYDTTFTTLGSTGCHADFAVYPDSNAVNSYHFIDQSTGNIAILTWDFGDGGQIITNPGSPNVYHTYALPGTYMVCLSIQGNDSSCFDTHCDTLFVGTPTPCHAAFTAIADSMNTYHFTDQSTGSPVIISWSWNFGDPASGANNVSQVQNPTHAFSTPGYYVVCLTIYGSGNCSDVTCDTIVVGTGPGCQANFSYAINPGPGNNIVTFTDLSQGSVLSWLWNFGDPLSGPNNSSTLQNPSHTYTTPGYYNVCLTIAGNNCTSIICKTVEIQDSVNYHQVYGQVFAGNFPINMGMAMIFSIDTTGSYQPYIDVFPIDSNGVYYFTMVPNGNYYILAIPFDSAAYLPTYYGNALTWQQATVINLGTANNPYNINLLASGNMTNGPGSATGQINMDQLKSTFLVDKVSMILMNAQGTAIGFTNVSITGEFGFPTLAYGTYYLHPEMPGITSDNVMIELTPEKPNTQVTMTFVGNSILGMKEEISMVSSWNVYPNPVNDKVSVDLDIKQSSTVQADIYDLTGHLLVMKQFALTHGGNHFELAVSSLPTGIYSLRIHSAEGMNLVVKLIKTK